MASRTREPIDRSETLDLHRKFDDAADAPAGDAAEPGSSPNPTVVNNEAVPGAPERGTTESVGTGLNPIKLFPGGKKRRGKKSRKSRKGKKPRKGKKSRKNKRTKRR